METILLTGASRGIGAAILRRLKQQNKYRFVIVGRNRPDDLGEDSDNVLFVDADLTDVDATQSCIKKILNNSSFRNVDVIINNAGMGYFANLEKIDFSVWTKVLNINLNSAFLFMHAFLPGMKARNYGRIINISSDADHIGFPEAGVYCASKFGILGLSEALRKELIGTNIAITVISPGRVDTFFNGKKPGDRPISLKAEDVAEQVSQILLLRDNCNVELIRMKSTLE